MKVLIQLLRAVLTLIWALVLVVGVRLYLDETVDGSHPPQLMGQGLWSVTDSRMEPAYKTGDLVLVEMGKTAQPGDAVLVQGRKELELSRIIGTSEGQFILKPDGAEESVLMAPESVAGFLRSLMGLGAVFLVGVVLIFLPGRLAGKEKERYRPRH